MSDENCPKATVKFFNECGWIIRCGDCETKARTPEALAGRVAHWMREAIQARKERDDAHYLLRTGHGHVYATPKPSGGWRVSWIGDEEIIVESGDTLAEAIHKAAQALAKENKQ